MRFLTKPVLLVVVWAMLWACVAVGGTADTPSTLKDQIAATEKELKADQKDLFELKDVFTKADEGEKPVPAPVKAQALQEWNWAKKNLEFAQQRIEKAKTAPNDAAAQVELNSALDMAKKERDWKRRAQSSLSPPPAIRTGQPQPRAGSVLGFSSRTYDKAVEVIQKVSGFDTSDRPDVQMADPVNWDPQAQILTTSSGRTIPIKPFNDTVQKVLPDKLKGKDIFVSAPLPDSRQVVLRMDPEVAKYLASPKAQAELKKIGGVALDVTLNLLSYAGVAEFRRQGPATVVESPVLVSLGCLYKKVSSFASSPEAWQELPDDLRYPAAIERIHGFVLDHKNQDVFLVASPAKASENRIDIDALIVGLQCIWRDGVIPRVSLDPVPERPAGPQYTRVEGVPLQTTFAKTMLDADYAMKRILFGDLDVGMPHFREIDVDSLARYEAEFTPSRYWLTPMPLSDRDVQISPTCRSVLFESSVRCLTEAQNSFSEWSGKPAEWSERKAKLFTESYEQMERSLALEPRGVFVRLHGLVDLVTACKMMHDLEVDYPILRSISELPLRCLRDTEAVPSYYPGLSVAFAKKRLSDSEQMIFTHNGGAVLRSRVNRRSLDLYQDVATATLEHEVDTFPREKTFAKTLHLPLTLRKSQLDDRGGTEYALLVGQATLRDGRYDDARVQFETLTTSDPLFTDAWAWRAEALSLAGRHKEAASTLNKALELEPQYLVLKGMEFRILYRAGKTPADLRLNRDESMYLSRESIWQAAALAAQGRSADATKEATCALRLWHENPDAYFVRALVAKDETSDVAMRDRQEAIRLYKQQLKENKVQAEMCRRSLAFVLLQDALARSKKLQNTVGTEFGGFASFQEAWKEKPNAMNKLLLDFYNVVSEAKEVRNLDELDGLASAVYARVLAGMMTIIFAGGNLIDKGLGEAADLSKDVVERFPNLPDGHFARAYVASTEITVVWTEMKRQGLYNEQERVALTRALAGLLAETLEQLDTAVRLDPTYGEAFLFRALTYANMRQEQKALEDLEKAKELLTSVDPRLEQRIRHMCEAASP